MTWAPTTLSTSSQRYHSFCPSSSTKIDTVTLHTVVAALYVWQDIICEWCGIIGHKDDACIVCGPKFLPPIIKINMNQFNSIRGDVPTDPPREWNSPYPEYWFKSSISLPKTSPVLPASWGYLIIMPLIMMMLSFTLHSLPLNITLNLFQILTPLQPSQLMIMKWTISWNYSTKNTMMIFCMLTSKCFIV